MTSKRVGVYNRWLTTLGGGEKYSLSIAAYIGKFHDVEVISHKPISKDLAAERLDLDLSQVRFKFIPELSVIELPQITKNYDLFVNASFMDFYPSLAKLSAYIIYFPDKLGLKVSVRRSIKGMLRTWLDMPMMVAGVCKFVSAPHSFEWHLDSISKMRLPASPRSYRVSFDVSVLSPLVKKITLYLNNVKQIEADHFIPGTQTRLHALVPASDEPSELLILIENEEDEVGKPKVILSNLNLDLLPYQAFHRIFENKFRDWGSRLYYYSQAYTILDHLDTYQVLWSISEFTHYWTKKYWHRESEILRPIVNPLGYRNGEKKPQIISVGRFFAGHHNKKHLEMIKAFKEMVDGGLNGWELHLVGNLAAGDEHKAYFEAVKNSAQNYPIFIHQDISFQELKELYSASSIYWHASGFGENERKEPIRFEHFGLTTIESMASGCVPVVIGKGGQKEIVNHGKDGFLWGSLEELKKYTWLLIKDQELRKNMSAEAATAAGKIGPDNFEKTIGKVLQQME